MEYREIAPGELDRALFRHFERRQEVTKCRRRENGPCARRKKAVSVGPFGGGDTGVLRGDGLRGGPGVQ